MITKSPNPHGHIGKSGFSPRITRKITFVHRSAIPEGRPTAETGKISTIIE